MKVSYENLLLEASSISATNENINQPVTNIYHRYLELPFYATGQTSVIQIDFTTTHAVDHIAYGFHNLNTLNVKLYDALLVLSRNIDITLEENESIYYFTSQPDVKRIILTCSTLSALLYIGTIFVGEYQEFPRFEQSPNGGIELRDSDFTSPGGQSSGNRKRNLPFHSLSIKNITNDERADFIAYYNYVQKSIPHFVDMYPDSHDKEPVFYGKIISTSIPLDKRKISAWKYDSNVNYREAR